MFNFEKKQYYVIKTFFFFILNHQVMLLIYKVCLSKTLFILLFESSNINVFHPVPY